MHQYLEFPNYGSKSWILLCLLIQKSHILVKLADVCRVHLQIGPLFQENVCYLGILIPVTINKKSVTL